MPLTYDSALYWVHQVAFRPLLILGVQVKKKYAAAVSHTGFCGNARQLQRRDCTNIDYYETPVHPHLK